MCIRDRAIIVNFSPLYSINELSKQVKDSGIKILVTIDHRELYEKTSNLLQTTPVSYTHLRAHETVLDLVCRLLLEKKKQK